MEFAKKSLLAKAKDRPDQVRRVLEKAQTDGWLETLRQVRQRLDDPLPLGYSSAGVVIECGEEVQQFQVGDRVASNGGHASFVSVPVNLVARVPEGVSFDRASFGVVGSIALQGVRLSRCVLGETAFVIGLGLVGQLTVGLLRAAGCRVFGTDPDPAKCELAKLSGADVARPGMSAAQVSEMTGGRGADSVIITASTSSNAPINLACDAVRQKGRIVLVGVVGMEMPRRPMFFKEVEFVVSCSYGPGRYDPNYEDRGLDYPVAHVRWTEQRNMQAVLDLIGDGKLRVDHLVSHQFEIADAETAYQMIESGSEPYLGIVLNYPASDEAHRTSAGESYRIGERSVPRSPQVTVTVPAGVKPKLGVLGAGNFAKITMLPAVRRSKKFEHLVLCSAGGLSAAHAGKSFGFTDVTATDSEVFDHPDVDSVMVLTRHNMHASQTIRALDAGKHVFVEKPLAISWAELSSVSEAVRRNPDRVLMVGFNRRFSAPARHAKAHFQNTTAPLTIQYRFNAGAIAADSWVQHLREGGGRLIGEACHAIDFVTFLAGSQVITVDAVSIGGAQAPETVDDHVFITLRHANGSISSIGYLAGGDRSMPKERVEILGGGRSCVIDDFKAVTCYSGGKRRHTKHRTGKGHLEEVCAFAEASQSRQWPISWVEIESTTAASIAAMESIKTGRRVDLRAPESAREAA